MEKKNSIKAHKEEEKKVSTSKTTVPGKTPANTIWFYREKDRYGFMSNFWPSPINIGGKSWPTTEHYFQAMKFPTKPEHQEKIRSNKSAWAAKKSGQCRDGFRPDWENVKDDVMYDALMAKFT